MLATGWRGGRDDAGIYATLYLLLLAVLAFTSSLALEPVMDFDARRHLNEVAERTECLRDDVFAPG